MARQGVIQDFLPADHDHEACVDQALTAAEEACKARGERFTPLRRQVLELLWRNHRAVKAYELLDMLAASGRRPAPPTVYRTLDFLQSVGLVHKIESLNAFLGCANPSRRHLGQFLICQTCGDVGEMDDATIRSRIDETARRLGFTVESEKVEVVGECRSCAEEKLRVCGKKSSR